MQSTARCALLLALYACLGTTPAPAQVQTQVPAVVPGAKPVSVQHIQIHGLALEGNLEGDAVDREVLVFLPPSYAREKSRRYPVIYALHGYSIGAQQWSGEIHVPQTIEGAFAQGAHEAIVVLPDSKTAHNGSMYSGSVTTGRSLPVTLSIILMRITAPSRNARAGDSWVIPWAAMERPGSE
jgi:enterochelin esterase-like enzyme